MNTSNTLDLPIPLTEAELQHLWAPVPRDRQQREEMVRISLRPELDADYTGPVEFRDLRLAVSPWLWSKAELGCSPRTQALNQALAQVRAANPDMELDAMPSVVQWLKKKLQGTRETWALFPTDASFWEDCGNFQLMRDSNYGTFVPIDLEVSVVYFYTESGEATHSRLVVAQTRFDKGETMEWGPIGIYTSSQGTAEHISDTIGWLNTSDALLLKNLMTGEQAKLMPGEVYGADEDYGDGQGIRRGMDAVFADAITSSLVRGQAPAWVSGALHYKAGHLYLTNTTEQALTLELFLPPGHVAN